MHSSSSSNPGTYITHNATGPQRTQLEMLSEASDLRYLMLVELSFIEHILV